MAYALTWLPAVLRAAGLKVIEQPGWKTRGRAEMGKVRGVLCHHTAGPLKGNAPSLTIVKGGRDNLPGPLAQLVLGRDGTFYVVAAGRANHAGIGAFGGGKNNGNDSLIGIEAENTGLANDHPWPAVQLDAYARGVAAILTRIGAGAEMCLGHLEYATPVGRKSDPSFSVGTREQRLKAMAEFRARVAALMRAKPARLFDEAPATDEGPGDHDTDPGGMIPAEDAPAADAPRAAAPEREAVAQVQTRLKALGYFGVGEIDGDLAGKTRGAIVRFKHDNGLTPETPEIDQAFLAALATAKPAPISEARATATAADVAPSAPSVNETWWSRLWAKILAIPALFAGFFGWLQDNFDSVREKLDPITSILGKIPFWAWLSLAGGIAIVIWRSQRHAEQGTIDLYRQGRIQ